MRFRRQPHPDDRPVLKSHATNMGCIGPLFDCFLALLATLALARFVFWLVRG